MHRDVAIKVLPQAFAQDADRMTRFEREAQVLASLNHPNIAAIYGIEENAIVMEFVEGGDLKVPLPLHTALDYARQIAEALDAAHEKGIVHRDLKPANIKVTPSGVVKVLDFGLAKTADATPRTGSASISPTMTFRATEAGMIMGTAGYMSPEQASGKPVDRRADICVLLFIGPTGQRDVWIQDIAQDTRIRLTFDGKSGTVAEWSPDGKYVLYNSHGEIWWTRSDGGGQPRMLLESGNPCSLSPDGKRLLFGRLVSTGIDLMTVTLESSGDALTTGKPELFLATPSRDGYAHFSQDGRWIAYTSTESGTSELYVRPFPGPGGKWQISTGGGEMPVWSRGDLFYLDNTGRIIAVPHSTKDGAFVAGGRRVWWSGRVRQIETSTRNYDVSADGKRIVAIQDSIASTGTGSSGRVTVLLNFYDKLLRRVPRR